MNRERNLLRELFALLTPKYAKRGWLLEYVDLRWGITSEASLDNNTVGVCLDELNRCKTLSPKPNFIILSGQRRGWIPLPEEIPEYIYDTASTVWGAAEHELFRKWYRLDTNDSYLHKYILQPRTGRYVDDEVWIGEVYYPLMRLFENDCLPSATELEIEEGAMAVADSREHVIAYVRNLNHIPGSLQSVFFDNAEKEIEELRTNLTERLSQDNVYNEDISYEEYMSDSFAARFKSEMECHITDVVERAISETNTDKTENQLHLSIAEELATDLIGREDTISFIDRYLKDPTKNHAIWIRAKSGVGKSALSAEICRRYNSTHRVIARFCGETDFSTCGEDIFQSIWKELLSSGKLPERCLTNLPKQGEKGRFGMYDSISDGFRSILSLIKTTRPVVIVIDAVDQLISTGSEEFFWLFWADCELAPGVKIIITSTEDRRINTKHNYIETLPLNPLSDDYALAFVDDVMTRRQRCLTLVQRQTVKQSLKVSEHSPLYLTILANLLCTYHSYDEIPDIPTDFGGLVNLILRYVTEVRKHDAEFVRLALSLFVCDRLGLTQNELLNAVSADAEFMEHLEESSLHPIECDIVPPILWSRLQADLNYFFRIRHGRFGTLTYIYHNALAHAIRSEYLPDDALELKAHIFDLLASAYQNQDTPHAVREVLRCNYQAFAYGLKGGAIHWTNCSTTTNLIRNLGFLHNKLTLDRDDLMNDFLLAIEAAKVCNPNMKEEIMNIRKDIADVPDCSFEDFVLFCANMHPRSPLSNLARSLADNLLADTLAGSVPYGLVECASQKSGENPILGNNGLKLLSLKDMRHTVYIENMQVMNDSASYSFISPVTAIAASANLDINILIVDGQCLVYDCPKKSVIDRAPKSLNPKWVTISDDGTNYACGSENEIWIKNLGMQNFGARNGLISGSGNNLWLENGEALIKVSLNGDSSIIIVPEGYNPSEPVSIIFATDFECLFTNAKYAYCIRLEDNFGNYSYTRLGFTAENFGGGAQTFHIKAAGLAENSLRFVNDFNYGYAEISLSPMLITRNHGTSPLYGIEAISRNGRFAYSVKEQKVYNLDLLRESFLVYEQYNAGLNTIASDRSGSLIAVTMGKNEHQDLCTEILVVNNGAPHKLNLAEISPGLRFFRTCAVKPDGNLIWLAETSRIAGEGIICIDRAGKLIGRIPVLNAIIAMRLTGDGRFLVAVSGHHIADANLMIYVIDCSDMSIITGFDADPKMTYSVRESWQITLSESGRYIYINDNQMHVIDIRQRRTVTESEALKIYSAEFPAKSNFEVRPDGHIIFRASSSGKPVKHSYLPGICLWTENDKGLVAVTRSGRVSFFVPTEV